MGAAGLEHPSQTAGKQGVALRGGAESGALGIACASSDARLLELLRVWPVLENRIREVILTVAKSSLAHYPSGFGLVGPRTRLDVPSVGEDADPARDAGLGWPSMLPLYKPGTM
jgi:hypothetical protein